MKVLVTGATGFVGGEIVRRLHDSGSEVRALARTRSSKAKDWSAMFHVGNVLEAASLKDACQGMDAVIHLVGIISEAGRNTLEAVHIDGTRNIVTAAREAGVKRFVQMSALGTRAGAASRYHKSKWEAEQIVRDSGMDWTILRPSIIYGPGDGFVNLFAKIIRRSPIVPIIGKGFSRYQPVPVAAVAAAFVKSLTEPLAIGRTFELGGAETLSMNEIIDEILEVMRRRRLKLHIPITLARMQARFLEFTYANIFGKPPPLNRDQIVMLQEDNLGDEKPAAELFKLQATSFREGISSYLAPPNGTVTSQSRKP